MRRARLQLSALSVTRPSTMSRQVPCRGLRTSTGGRTPRANHTRGRTEGAAAPSAEVGKVRRVEWRESVPTMGRQVSRDQCRG